MLPSLAELSDRSIDKTHYFSTTANWLIPGLVMAGHYPGSCPSRPASKAVVEERLQGLRDAGICTFVCLQEELPPQDTLWPAHGIPKQGSISERAKFATAHFYNYREAAGPGANYLHFGLSDMSTVESLDALDEIVCELQRRVESGDKLYIHCWGGRGRTGLVAACLIGAIYGDLDATTALSLVQRAYELREPSNQYMQSKQSPETEAQRQQVHDWFSYRRLIARADVAPAVGSVPTFKIYDAATGETALEVISPSAIHPLTHDDALGRARQARRLGAGQFGCVYQGVTFQEDDGCAVDGCDVAIKVTPDTAPSHAQSRLALEARVLRDMGGARGFPTLLYEGRQTVFGQRSDVLVMELLGAPVSHALDGLSTQQERDEAVLRIAHDLVRATRVLHAEGHVHNDIKPDNILFGTPSTPNEDVAHLLDFGSVTPIGCSSALKQSDGDATKLHAGGGTPLFASVNQLRGLPTTATDDMESLWYVLAYLLHGELPWQWEPAERVLSIKQQLFASECGVVSDSCDSQLASLEYCSTKHCLGTYDKWDVPEALHEFWAYVVEGHQSGSFDYMGSLQALLAPNDVQEAAAREADATGAVASAEVDGDDEVVGVVEPTAGSSTAAPNQVPRAAPEGFEWGLVV